MTLYKEDDPNYNKKFFTEKKIFNSKYYGKMKAYSYRISIP